MSAGMLEAKNSKLKNSGNGVDFLMALQLRGIMVINRLLGLIVGNSLPRNFQGMESTVLIFESHVFFVMASISGFITVTSSLLIRFLSNLIGEFILESFSITGKKSI